MTYKPEILSPAGNFEKMKAAILYGADAVYLAGKVFDGNIRLVLEDGARIDLDGGTLNVYQFLGNLADVDGTVKAAAPCLGTVMVIR